MTSLQDAMAPASGASRLVTRLSNRLGAVSRRGFFLRSAMAGTALAVDPRTYALRPVTAYSTICGPGNTAGSGWTVFCCTINKGVNACPPGSFAAGWWKSADSSWCCGGYRYIVDCNAACTTCSSGCSGDHICDPSCWNCRCGSGSTATCDQRRVCCNAFRYGQCNTQVGCSGGVHCRVVSCIPPYRWTNCTTTSLSDNRTSEHGAPCLQGCGAILAKYDALGGNGSFLKASLGPERAVGDNRGRYVAYQGGLIYWTPTTGAWSVHSYPLTSWKAAGAPGGFLGYPRSDMATTKDAKGWIQVFEHGAITDSTMTTTQYVYGPAWTVWSASGRESGSLGYPSSGRAVSTVVSGSWVQSFQRGAIASSTAGTFIVNSYPYPWWLRNGGQNGVLRSPTSAFATTKDGKAWIQVFQGGALVDSLMTTTQVVPQPMYAGWVAAGREGGVLSYPSGGSTAAAGGRGSYQRFLGGELWALTGKPAYAVYGRVLAAWQAAGGPTGRYGYPVSNEVANADGTQTCTFEGGTITA